MNTLIKALLVVSSLLLSSSIFSQQDVQKETLRLNITYEQIDNNSPILKVSAKTKVGRKFENVEGVNVNLYFNEESAQGFMGQVLTNSKGLATLKLPNMFRTQWDSLMKFNFIATVTSNQKFEDEISEIEITKSRIELSVKEEDSVKYIVAKVMAFEDSTWIEVPDIELKFIVTRLLSNLVVGGDDIYMTDESGEASVEFDMDIPADNNGDIFIGAKIDDSDVYGTIMSTKKVNWGIPQKSDGSFAKRTLWATRDKTPWWLLIFPNLIIVSVWGIIFYLLYQLLRIRKIGQA